MKKKELKEQEEQEKQEEDDELEIIELPHMVPTQDLTFQEILNNMIDGTNDIDLKTEIIKPKELTTLKMISEYLKQIGYPISGQLLEDYIEFFLRYMFSHKRKSRNEVIKALIGFSQSELDDSNISRRFSTKRK